MSYNVGWDSIFPGVDPRQAEKFQRIILAVDPDLLALQEIRKSASDVAELLDAIAPLPDGQQWHVFKGQAGVIASKYPLRMLSDRIDPPSYRDPVAALVDLPDDRFEVDLYVLNNHFKCCDGEKNDPIRQQQADAVASRLRDVRTTGGELDLPPGTPVVVVGDLNLVGGFGPLETVLSGDIADERRYGPDLAPDWDGTWLCAAHPLHNAVGPDDYTWRDDNSEFAPSRLDFVIYTDSILESLNAFVLNTTQMSEDELLRSGLSRYDVAEDELGRRFDHLPVVVDFKVAK
jgi:endonuclease/exonuclease/phosphatase family metal-dependent hydrolase